MKGVWATGKQADQLQTKPPQGHELYGGGQKIELTGENIKTSQKEFRSYVQCRDSRRDPIEPRRMGNRCAPSGQDVLVDGG